jgi:phenylalanyl-tRNA synthetase beta chain
MKLIYSTLKKFIPTLDVTPQQLRDDLTLIGHFANYYELIGENDFIIDLDIKVNRGDCLGYYGLARDLAVYYQQPWILPAIDNHYPSDKLPNIEIKSAKVKRVLATQLSNLKINTSPDWLLHFLEHHDINPINNLVDLSNYIMLLYGIPCHTFDAAKINHRLIWEDNSRFSTFTTLDGTQLKLSGGELILSNDNQALSLSFIGGQNSGIDADTTQTIVEMAVYDRGQVRRDSRGLRTVTEAGIRLEKDLDPKTIPLAFDHLIFLIQEVCGGNLSGSLFDYYPSPSTSPSIEFDPSLPSIYAGIDIPADFALDSLQRLGCTISRNLITPPSIRRDLTLTEDLIEEVMRFYGYQHIPTNQPLEPKDVTDITPPILYVIEKLKDELVALGYDEIRSWPLTAAPLDPSTVVTTENSINSEYIYLRQSIIQSLKLQLDQYQRLKLPSPQFFEIGKIFSQIGDKYQEFYSLGLYHPDISVLQKDLEKIGLQAKFDDNFAEITLEESIPSLPYTPQVYVSKAIELTSQIITLDANINLSEDKDPLELIKEYSHKIDPSILWQMVITDSFHDPKTSQYRYTFRVSYYNCTDKEAKKIHLDTFGLN